VIFWYREGTEERTVLYNILVWQENNSFQTIEGEWESDELALNRTYYFLGLLRGCKAALYHREIAESSDPILDEDLVREISSEGCEKRTWF
jgi:hypothetical protein